MSDNGTSTSSDTPSTEPAAVEKQANPEQVQDRPKADTADVTDWKAAAEKAQADAEKYKALSRKHEDRAKSNAEAASKAKTVEEQLEEMRKVFAERDLADVKKAGRLARTQVEAKVAESGFSASDVAPLLDRIDPGSLLKDGEPDPKEIAAVVASLIKAGGRTTPDRDQGKRGGDGPLDMNALIRRRAGIGS